MDFDSSWTALFDPGRASCYFDPVPEARLDAAAAGYSSSAAWWLAELSRLIYRDNPSEPGAGLEPGTRDEILTRVGLSEKRSFRWRSTRCAIVEPRGEAPAPFAVLVFRGTDGPRDWRTNVKSVSAAWPGGGRVHAGFKSALDGIWPELDAALATLAAPLFYTGHSLGGALATLAASRRRPRAVYTFGAPGVGDDGFVATLAGVEVYRVVHRRDVVPRMPPDLGLVRFRHAGEVCRICAEAPAAARGRPSGARAPGRRRWFDPPGFLSDHSPVNYVACLERSVGTMPAG